MKITIFRNLLFIVTLGISLSTMQPVDAMQEAGSAAASSSSSSSDSSSSSSSSDSFSNSSSLPSSSSADAPVKPAEEGKKDEKKKEEKIELNGQSLAGEASLSVDLKKLNLADDPDEADSDGKNEVFWKTVQPFLAKIATLLDDKKTLKEITNIDVKNVSPNPCLDQYAVKLKKALELYCLSFKTLCNKTQGSRSRPELNCNVDDKTLNNVQARYTCFTEIKQLLEKVKNLHQKYNDKHNKALPSNAVATMLFDVDSSLRVGAQLLGIVQPKSSAVLSSPGRKGKTEEKEKKKEKERRPQTSRSSGFQLVTKVPKLCREVCEFDLVDADVLDDVRGDEKDDEKKIALSAHSPSQMSVRFSKDGISVSTKATMSIAPDDDVERCIDEQISAAEERKLFFIDVKGLFQKKKLFWETLQPAFMDLLIYLNHFGDSEIKKLEGKILQINVQKVGFELWLFEAIGILFPILTRYCITFKKMNKKIQELNSSNSLDEQAAINAELACVNFFTVNNQLKIVLKHCQDYVNVYKKFVDTHRKNQEMMQNFFGVEMLLEQFVNFNRMIQAAIDIISEAVNTRAELLGLELE